MNSDQINTCLEAVVETKSHLELNDHIRRAILSVGPTETPSVAIVPTSSGGLRVSNYLYDWTYSMDPWQMEKLNPRQSIR